MSKEKKKEKEEPIDPRTEIMNIVQEGRGFVRGSAFWKQVDFQAFFYLKQKAEIAQLREQLTEVQNKLAGITMTLGKIVKAVKVKDE